MKQLDLVFKGNDDQYLKKISIMVAANAFDCNGFSKNNHDMQGIQIACLMKLATHFFRRAFLENTSSPETRECRQVYLKALYFTDTSNFNSIRAQIVQRKIQDGIIQDEKPVIIKLDDIDGVKDIDKCESKAHNAHEVGFVAAEFDKKFDGAITQKWQSCLMSNMRSAPIAIEPPSFKSADEIKDNITIAIYIAARRRYQEIWKEFSHDKNLLQVNIDEFNSIFTGFAQVNESNFQLSELDDAKPLIDSLPLIDADRSRSFEGMVDLLIKRSAHNKNYERPAYLCLQDSLNTLNQQYSYFEKIAPPFRIAGRVPLVGTVEDTLVQGVKLTTDFARLTSARNEFEFTAALRRQHMPAVPKPPIASSRSTNPFDPAPKARPATVETPLVSENAPKAKEEFQAPISPPKPTITPPAPASIPKPNTESRRTITNASPKKISVPSSRKLTFGEKHPIWKRTLIGALIGLSIGIVASIALGLILLPPGGAIITGTLLTVTTITMSTSPTTFAGIIGGLLLSGSGIGALIGLSVGVSGEAKKRKNAALDAKRIPATDTDKENIPLLLPAPKVTHSPTRHSPVKTATQSPVKTISSVKPISPPKKPVNQVSAPPRVLQPKPQPTSNTEAPSFLGRIGGSLTTLIRPTPLSNDPREFKMEFLRRYGARQFRINHDEESLAKTPGVNSMVTSYLDNPVLFKIAICQASSTNQNIRPSLIDTLSLDKFKNFDIKQFEEREPEFYHLLAEVRVDLTSKKTFSM